MNLYVLLALANILMAILATAWMGFRDTAMFRSAFGGSKPGGRAAGAAPEQSRETGPAPQDDGPRTATAERGEYAQGQT